MNYFSSSSTSENKQLILKGDLVYFVLVLIISDALKLSQSLESATKSRKYTCTCYLGTYYILGGMM